MSPCTSESSDDELVPDDVVSDSSSDDEYARKVSLVVVNDLTLRRSFGLSSYQPKPRIPSLQLTSVQSPRRHLKLPKSARKPLLRSQSRHPMRLSLISIEMDFACE